MSCDEISLNTFKQKTARQLAEMRKGDKPHITIYVPKSKLPLKIKKVKNWIVTESEEVLVYDEHLMGGKIIHRFNQHIPNFRKRLSPTEPQCHFQLIPENEFETEQQRISLRVKFDPIRLRDGSELTDVHSITINSHSGIPDYILVVQEKSK